MTDEQLLQSWEDLCARLTWRYPIMEARDRYLTYADLEPYQPEALEDLLIWRRLGEPLDETTS